MESKMIFIFFFILISAASQLNIGAYAATYNVGDNLGWIFPPLGPIAYQTWAAKQNFRVRDILVFNFTTGQHNVAEVSKTNYDSCNTQSPISISNNGPANITLNGTGEHYYICAFSGHCAGGMKLAINVSASSTNTPAPQQPAPTPAPVSAPSTNTPTPKQPAPASAPVSSPPSSRTPVRLVVGDALGWTFPPLGPVAYQTWAAKQNFVVGDILEFNFTTGHHNVAEVSKASYNSCNTQSPISISNNGPANITLNTTGEHYYICTYKGHCSGGMKLAINVSAATTTNPSPQSPAPVSANGPSGSSTPPPSSSATSNGPSGSTTPPPSSSATSNGPSGSTTTSSATPPNGSVPPPPSPSSASTAVAAIPFALLSIAFTLFY